MAAPRFLRILARPLTKSFQERNAKVVGAICLTLVVAGTGFALLLQGGLLTPKYHVTAYFSDAAGIASGDRVTVAGLQAGRVESVEVQGGRVAIDLGIDRGVELPADTRAEIKLETLLGRRSVELEAGSSPQQLQDGDVIPIERTQTPVDITDLNDISVRLLNRSDANAFESFLREVTEVTEGKEQQVRTIITGLERVTAAVDSRRRQLGDLIISLRTIATTLGERDETVVSLIDNLDAVMRNLAERQQQLATLLVATDAGAHETAGLVVRNRAQLDSALGSLHDVLQVLDRHQLDLAATISYLEQAVRGYSSVGYSGGTENRWANIFVQSLGPAGVDALIGECGAVDQFFDHFFGTDCHDSGTMPDLFGPSSKQVNASASATDAGPVGGLVDDVLDKLPPLPCGLKELVQGLLSGEPEQGCVAL